MAEPLRHGHSGRAEQLLDADQGDVYGGLALFERVEGLGAFDAVLAVAAIAAGATTLVSADSGFAEVPGLPHTQPDAAGVAALLA